MKLTRLFQQSDNSSELKPGEIKEILIRTAARFLPDFKYLMSLVSNKNGRVKKLIK